MADISGDDDRVIFDRQRRVGWRAGRRWLAVASMIAMLVTSFLPFTAFAEDIGFDVDDLRSEDQGAMESLAGYPEEERRAAFIVAGQPEALLAIQELQRDSAQKFADLVAAYPREVQETVWNLVRFPNLAAELARGGRKSEAALGMIASRFPAEIRDAISASGKEHYPLWVKIYALELEAKQDYRAVLHGQSESLKDAFDVVEQRPDLMNLLAENMHMTTLLGAGYRDDPRGVEKHFSTLERTVALEKHEREQEWANELQDPEAAEELRLAAREFADEYGYAYREGYQDGAYDERRAGDYNRDYYPYPAYAYPYWFGYPSWYHTAYWYPRSISRHVGFYYRGGHSFVSVGLPSLLFLDWYHASYYPRHHGNHARSHKRSHRRTVGYFDRHRPYRSASHRRHVSAIGRQIRSDGHRNDDGVRRRDDRDRNLDRDASRLGKGKILPNRKQEPRRDVDRKMGRDVRQGPGRVEHGQARPEVSRGSGSRLKPSGDRSAEKREEGISRDQKRVRKGAGDSSRHRPHVSAGPRGSVDHKAKQLEKNARVRPSAAPSRIGGHSGPRERLATKSATPREREAPRKIRKSGPPSERRARPMGKSPRVQKKIGGSSSRMNEKNRDGGRKHQGPRGAGGRRSGQGSGGRGGR